MLLTGGTAKLEDVLGSFVAAVAYQVTTTTATATATKTSRGLHYAAIVQSTGVLVAAAGLVAAWRTLKFNETNQRASDAARLASQKESETARLAVVANEISQQYRSETLEKSRQLVGKSRTRADLQAAFFAARAQLNDDYFAFDRLLNFFEGIAILEQTGGITLEWIRLAIGTTIRDNWHAWSPTITALRDLTKQRTAYENFEALAGKLDAAMSGSDP